MKEQAKRQSRTRWETQPQSISNHALHAVGAQSELWRNSLSLSLLGRSVTPSTRPLQSTKTCEGVCCHACARDAAKHNGLSVRLCRHSFGEYSSMVSFSNARKSRVESASSCSEDVGVVKSHEKGSK